jgi:FlaA1/EpsC-like NDP-sugar epimerase
MNDEPQPVNRSLAEQGEAVFLRGSTLRGKLPISSVLKRSPAVVAAWCNGDMLGDAGRNEMDRRLLGSRDGRVETCRAEVNSSSESSRLGVRYLPMMAFDVGVVVVSYLVALLFRYAGTGMDYDIWTPEVAAFLLFAVIVHVVVNQIAGVYSIAGRYMSLVHAVRVGEAALIATVWIFIGVVIWPLFGASLGYPVPRPVAVGGGLLTGVLMVLFRFSGRIARETNYQSRAASERVLLIGAGQTADMIIREIQRTPSLEVQVVGLVDDRPSARHTTIQGATVLGSIDDIPKLVAEHEPTQLILAIPSLSTAEMARIYRICKPTGVPLKVIPSLVDMVAGRASFADAREIDIKDLLGRKKIEIDVGGILSEIHGRSVLVTGAGGSIGSEMCRQIAGLHPDRLVLVDHDESSLYALHETLRTTDFHRYVLCPTSILKQRKLDKIFQMHRPDVVYHAAAYKHVPLMELSPDEAVLNNVRGTLMVAEAAARHGCRRFVNISTDKAVDPVNVMGATKRAAELVVRKVAAQNPGTLFACVRFGNVLGSQGSVVPLFKSQITGGGPVVVTHPGMTRYFMLIEEAVQLVLQATTMMEEEAPDGLVNLNTFVLDMGEPVSIVDLAQHMIEFFWSNNGHSLGVEFTGLRPGEKLDEALVWDHEVGVATSHPLITRVCSRCVEDDDADLRTLEENLPRLLQLAAEHQDPAAIRGALMRAVRGYMPLEYRADGASAPVSVH